MTAPDPERITRTAATTRELAKTLIASDPVVQKRIRAALRKLAKELKKSRDVYKVINLRTKQIEHYARSHSGASDYMKNQPDARNLLLLPPDDQPTIVHM